MKEHSPYAQALSDFWRGAANASYVIHRDDGFTAPIAAGDAYATPPFDPVEERALEEVTGRVLDVGAGAGRHALVLQARGHLVRAIEPEPALVQIMTERGVVDARAQRLSSVSGAVFDTIVMLMNGFGLVGTLAGADPLFAHMRTLLAPGGQVLCDSLDVTQTQDERHLAYQQTNLAAGRPPGQLRIWISYEGRDGEAFDWLHLAYEDLARLAARNGWSAEKLHDDGGQYLARLRPC